MNDYQKWMEDWQKKQDEKANTISEKYKDTKVSNEQELSSLIAELMIDYGPDGHCDGHEIIAKVIWNMFKVNQ